MPFKLKNRLSKKMSRLNKSKRSRRLQKKSFFGGKPLDITTTEIVTYHSEVVNSTIFHSKSIGDIEWGVALEERNSETRYNIRHTFKQQHNTKYLMAVGCIDGSIKLYLTDNTGATPTLIAELVHNEIERVEVNCLMFNPHLPVLASGGSDGIVKLWQFRLRNGDSGDLIIELDKKKGNNDDGSYTISTKTPIKFDWKEQFNHKEIKSIDRNRIYCMPEDPGPSRTFQNKFTFKNDDPIMFIKRPGVSSDTLPTEINSDTIYYVLHANISDESVNSFYITDYIGGRIITISDTNHILHCVKIINADITRVNSISFYDNRSWGYDRSITSMFQHMAISGDTQSIILLTLQFSFGIYQPNIVNANMLKHSFMDNTNINVHFCSSEEYLVTTGNYTTKKNGSIILWKMNNLQEIQWTKTDETTYYGSVHSKYRAHILNGEVSSKMETDCHISSVTSHPQLPVLAIGCNDGSVRICGGWHKGLKQLTQQFNLGSKSLTVIHRITFHTTSNKLDDVEYDDDYNSKVILASAANNTIRIWTISPNFYGDTIIHIPELNTTLKIKENINSISFLPNNASNILMIGRDAYTQFLNYKYIAPSSRFISALSYVSPLVVAPIQVASRLWYGSKQSTTDQLAKEAEIKRLDEVDKQDKINKTQLEKDRLLKEAKIKALQSDRIKAADEQIILETFISNITSGIQNIITESSTLETYTRLKLNDTILECVMDFEPKPEQNIYCKNQVDLLQTAIMVGVRREPYIEQPNLETGSILICNPANKSPSTNILHTRGEYKTGNKTDRLNQNIMSIYNPALVIKTYDQQQQYPSPHIYNDPDEAYLQKFLINTSTYSDDYQRNGFGGYSLFFIHYSLFNERNFDLRQSVRSYYIAMGNNDISHARKIYVEYDLRGDIQKYIIPIKYNPYKFYDVYNTNEGKAYLGYYVNDKYHGIGHYYTCFAYGSKVKILDIRRGSKIAILTNDREYPYSNLWIKPGKSNICTIDILGMDKDIDYGDFGTIVGYTNPLKVPTGQHIVVEIDKKLPGNPYIIVLFTENDIELLTKYSFHGHFNNGLRHGYGEIYVHSLNLVETPIIFKGNFENDERNGYGIIHYLDNYTFEGYFEKDKRHGYGKITNLLTKKHIYAKFENGNFVENSYHKLSERINSTDTSINEFRKYVEEKKYGLDLFNLQKSS